MSKHTPEITKMTTEMLIQQQISDLQQVLPVRKKGRPRKNVVNPDSNSNSIDTKQDSEKGDGIKQKRKRGRKAAVKYVSSSIRKKISLPVTSIKDNDKAILHISLPETHENIKKEITYDVLKDEYIKSDQINEDILGNFIASQINIDTVENNHNSSIIEYSNKENSIQDTDMHLNQDDQEQYSQEQYSQEQEYQTLEEFDETIDEDTKTNTSIRNILIDKNQHYDTDLKKLYKDKLELRMNQDILLAQKLEELHNDDDMFNNLITNINEKINNLEKNKEDVKNQIIEDNVKNRKFGFFTILGEFLPEHTWPTHTDIHCWWCCHHFDTIPIGLPISYKDKKFIVKGIFCSFACSIAYNDDCNSINSNKDLIHLMYKKLTGNYINDPILYKKILINQLSNKGIEDYTLIENYIQKLAVLVEKKLKSAPPRSALKMFGGELTIEEFRGQSNEKKIYKMIEYPMCIARDYIQEIDVQTLKNANATVFNTQTTKSTAKGISQFIEF